MFDIGFPELLIVSIVALLVIGPEKLPETIRGIAIWVNRMKRSLANIKADIESEIGADEIRRELHNDNIMKELNDVKSNLNNIVNDTNATLGEIKSSARIDPKSMMTPIDNRDPAPDEPEDNTTAESPKPAIETQDDGTKQSESRG